MKPLVLVTVILSLSAVASNYAFDDWPQWRGQKRDGISAERGLLKDWPAGGPPVAWRANGAGTGYCSTEFGARAVKSGQCAVSSVQ